MCAPKVGVKPISHNRGHTVSIKTML